MILGVDVSHHQPPDQIDWNAFHAAGVRFAIIRATYGVSQDDTFLTHVNNARAAGIVVGAYHFLRYKTSQPAAAQAEAFLEALAPLAPLATPMLPPCLDLEDNRFDMQITSAADRRAFVSMANTWLKEVELRLTRQAMIYTRGQFMDDILDDPPGFGSRPLWVAHYTTAAAPRLPSAWSRYHFWQYTETGRLPGYNGNLDLNRFDGTSDELKALVDAGSDLDWPTPAADADLRHAALGDQGVVHRVASAGLTLRSEPRISDQTFMSGLSLGHRVEVQDRDIDDRWAKVRTFVAGREQSGFMSQSYLRPLGTPAVERLVDAALAEWHRFDRGQGRETQQPYRDYVGEMWAGLGLDFDGGDTDVFWSAAAISHFVRNAGADYDGFQFSLRHSTYINDAIKKAAENTPAPFWGARLDDHPLQVGDIIAGWRSNPMTYEGAAASAKFPSHTDVVVGIRPGVAVTLGGNVSDSVKHKEYALDNSGRLVPDGVLFAVLRNQTA